MAQKREICEVDDLNSLEQPISKVSAHGVLTVLSPLKKGRKCNYFEGTLPDESDKTRMVGFNSSQQKLLSKFMDKRQPIQIIDCEAKQAWRGEKMELLLKGTTKIIESHKKMDVPRQEFQDDDAAPTTITLSQLQATENYKRVKVTVKVLSVGSPQKSKTSKKSRLQTIQQLH